MPSLFMQSSASSMPSTENNFKLSKSNEVSQSFCFGGIISIVGFIISSIVIVILLCMIRKYKKKLQKNRKSVKFDNTDFSYSSLLNGQTSSFGNYQIDSNNIVITKKLGSHVSLAEYAESNDSKIVALKILKCNKSGALKEIQALNSCKHKNIVSYFGMTEIDDQMCIAMEYMGGGNLHFFLVHPKNTIFFYNIFSYIFQILDAMVYLSEMNILHRQLMASNCLLNDTYEILKISDFGLARKMENNYEYISEKSEALPFRWLALETLKYQKFTVKGDVWSFGVLVWEIFQRGSVPYKELNLPELVDFLESGGRLPCPQYCPYELYEIMKKCWNKNPDERPTFLILKEEIKNLFEHFNAVERKEPLTKMHDYVEIKLHYYEKLKANEYINT